MIPLLEVCRRAFTGPITSENKFELETFYPTLQKLVQQYDIHHDPHSPVNTDDQLADAVFEAAIDLVSQVGLYCSDTHRVIQVDERELRQAIAEAPEGCSAGEGADAGVLEPRKPDDSKPPWCHVGTGIAASTEDIAYRLARGYGSIEEANSVAIPALESLDGQPITARSPLGIYAAIRSVKLARKALEECGRPGLPIMNLVAAASSDIDTIAASHPAFGIRPSDGWLVGLQAEMKISFEALNKIAFLWNWGANIGITAGPLLGGYCGGPEGTAVANTAYVLVGLALLQGVYHLAFPLALQTSVSTVRPVLWAAGISGQAVSRNLNYPVIGLGYTAAGPATKMCYYETAAFVLTVVSSGLSVQTPLPAKGARADYVTPLEMQFGAEVAKAATGRTRKEANVVVQELLSKYEQDISQPPAGKRFQDCYDKKTGLPLPEHRKLYEGVKEELAGLGIAL